MAHIKYTWKQVTSSTPDLPYAIEVVITTDVDIQPVDYVVICTDRIERADYNLSGGSLVFTDVKIPLVVDDSRHNKIRIAFGGPAFKPATPIVATIWGTRSFRIQDINYTRIVPALPANADSRLADDALQLAAKIQDLYGKFSAGLIASNAEHPAGNATKDPQFRATAWHLYSEYHNHYARDAVRLRDEMLNRLPSGSRDDMFSHAFADSPLGPQSQQNPDFYLSDVSQYKMVAMELQRLATALKKQSQEQ